VLKDVFNKGNSPRGELRVSAGNCYYILKNEDYDERMVSRSVRELQIYLLIVYVRHYVVQDVNKTGGMDLIAVCPKLIPMNNEGTFFCGFVTAQVIVFALFVYAEFTVVDEFVFCVNE